MALPFVSLITVNYNGKKYLEKFLESVENLQYPQKKYEMIVIDNASTDGSVSYLESNFSWVKIIKSDKNLGFGGGNNLGIKAAEGDLVILVNNDTVLNELFVKAMVDCFQKNGPEKIGAINAKLLLFDDYLPLTLIGAGVVGDRCRILDNREVANKTPFIIPKWIDMLYTEKIYVPVNLSKKGRLVLSARIKEVGFGDTIIPGRVKLCLGKETLFSQKIKRGKRVKIEIPLTLQLVNQYKVSLIQNAGNYLFRDGFGRDRGAIVSGHQQFYEADVGQYDEVEEVPGFCGAGVLLNKKALDQVGLFDDQFFMYYEDGDLSIRLKRAGWKVLYCPQAVIRHIHSASSKEWSHFFVYHVERSRLLLVAKQWPRLIFFREWLKYFFKDTLGLVYFLLKRKKKKKVLAKLWLRLKVSIQVLKLLPRNMLNTNRLTRKDLKEFL